MSVFFSPKKQFGTVSAFTGSVETLFGSHTMNSICLEKELFAAAERLAAILSCRMVPVTMAGGDAADGRSAIFVCSAAFEKKLGGQEAVVAKGRSMRAGQLMIIAEDQPAFAISEEFGGKLVRLSLPKSDPATASCDEYGLQLAATVVQTQVTFVHAVVAVPHVRPEQLRANGQQQDRGGDPIAERHGGGRR